MSRNTDNPSPLPCTEPGPASPTLASRLVRLLANEQNADFHFVMVDDGGRRIPAHKAIVGTGSDELYKIVYGAAWQTVVTGDTVDVDECSTDAFLEILRYIYTNEVSVKKHA